MITQITVEYKARSVKIKVGPNTLIRDLRSQSCQYLGLDEELYAIKHKSSFLSLSAPLKYTSLVQNSKVELTLATAKMRAMSSRAVPVNIKLQVQDLPSHFSDKLIHQFKSNDNIWTIFKYFESKSGINLTTRTHIVKSTETSGRLYYEAPVIKSFNCNISGFEDYKKTLSELGLTSKQENLRVRFEPTKIPIEEALLLQDNMFDKCNAEDESKETNTESNCESKQIENKTHPSSDTSEHEKKDNNLSMIENKNETEPKEAKNIENSITPTGLLPNLSQQESSDKTNTSESKVRDVKVYLPSTDQRKIGNSDDSSYTVSLNHSQAYQSQITKAANIGDGPLLTKKLRQNIEIEKMKKISEVQIRIRFPDLTHLQATFKATETIGQVVDFVQSAIAFPNLPFRIFSNPPKKYYHDRDFLLVRDCKFGTRNLIFFEWDLTSGLPKSSFPLSGILKPEYLNNGTSILNSPDIALDDRISKDSLGSSTEKNSTSSSSSSSNVLTKNEKEKKLFKFIKTGRK